MFPVKIRKKRRVKTKEKELYMKTFIHWSGRAEAEQQLATSWLWIAVFPLIYSPSFSVLSLSLSS